MNAAARLLPQVSGVYRSPSDAAEVQARALSRGAGGATVDLADVRSKSDLLVTLAVALALPDTFGRNWDALADSFQDLPVTAEGWLLHLKHASVSPRALGRDWSTLLEILGDAALYWKARGRAFIVFVDDVSALPAWQ